MNNYPKHFHIGTQKAGSTYLYNLLAGHPEAGLPREKEVNFFNANYEKGVEWYLRQFADNGRVLIDTSPKYFMHGEAVAPRIREYADEYLDEEPQFLLVLRNPVDYLYSHFKMHLKHRYFESNPETYPEVPEDILEFVKLYPDYLERARYHEILEKHWLKHFELKQFKIVAFEELIKNETEILPEILDWFGLSQQELEAARTSRNAMLKYNVLFGLQDKLVKHKKLKDRLKRSKVFNWLYDNYLTQKDDRKLSEHEREELWEYFEGDVDELETLLGRKMWGH
jgi:hypothetical protein